MKLSHVVGARPNFVKAAPVIRALENIAGMEQRIIHTGQHYDPAMSDNIIRDVGMREPDINLGIGSGSHAEQTAKALMALEADFIEHRPDMVVVYGDVNSTLAGALAASKLKIRIAHVEAGLRAFDRSMPEEINRILVDSISDIHFVTFEDALKNLLREGIQRDNVFFVGNTMIDSIIFTEPLWRESDVVERLGLAECFVLVTLHRPSNVDDPERLAQIVEQLERISQSSPVVFPVHPRTREKFERAGLKSLEQLKLIEPLPYVDVMSLIAQASVVITDSGGVQEETTFLGTPCLTVRDSTERPITLTHGTNQLVRTDELAKRVLLFSDTGESRTPVGLRLWEGKAATRLARSIFFDSESPIRKVEKPVMFGSGKK